MQNPIIRSAASNLLVAACKVADAIRMIEESPYKIALVVDACGRLVGTATDGDIRRGFLRGLTLDSPVDRVMKADPLTALADADHGLLQTQMMRSKIRYVPVVAADRTVLGLISFDDLNALRDEVDNWVVLMAGGLGSRLMPMTRETPKPLLRVGNKPVLETILESFLALQFRRFFIAVNHKAEMIKGHFGDGARWGAEIRYLEEETKLGTAGALGLLPERPGRPFVVMNGDVLTRINFRSLLDFHAEHGAAGTMCVREHDFQVPYGVVRLDGHRAVAIEEKPVHAFFVNAGIYVLEPQVLDRLPRGNAMDMTNLFQQLIDSGGGASVYPIREYWIDIGHADDFRRANGEYPANFA